MPFAGLALLLGGAVGARISGGARRLRPTFAPVPGFAAVGAVAGFLAALGLGGLLAVDSGTAALVDSSGGRIVTAAAAPCATRLRRWAWLPGLAVWSPRASGRTPTPPHRAGVGWAYTAAANSRAIAGDIVPSSTTSSRLTVVYRTGHRCSR